MGTVPRGVLTLSIWFLNKFPHWKPRLQSMSLFTLSPFLLPLYRQTWESVHLHVLLPHFWLTLEPTPVWPLSPPLSKTALVTSDLHAANWQVSVLYQEGSETCSAQLSSPSFLVGSLLAFVYPLLFPFNFLYLLSWVFSSPQTLRVLQIWFWVLFFFPLFMSIFPPTSIANSIYMLMALKIIPPCSEPDFPDLCLYIWLASRHLCLDGFQRSHTRGVPKGTLICLQNFSPSGLSISASRNLWLGDFQRFHTQCVPK